MVLMIRKLSMITSLALIVLFIATPITSMAVSETVKFSDEIQKDNEYTWKVTVLQNESGVKTNEQFLGNLNFSEGSEITLRVLNNLNTVNLTDTTDLYLSDYLTFIIDGVEFENDKDDFWLQLFFTITVLITFLQPVVHTFSNGTEISFYDSIQEKYADDPQTTVTQDGDLVTITTVDNDAQDGYSREQTWNGKTGLMEKIVYEDTGSDTDKDKMTFERQGGFIDNIKNALPVSTIWALLALLGVPAMLRFRRK